MATYLCVIKLKVMVLIFQDGEEFDLQGPLRTELRSDGWYVVGKGFLIPTGSQDEGLKLIETLNNKI